MLKRQICALNIYIYSLNLDKNWFKVGTQDNKTLTILRMTEQTMKWYVSFVVSQLDYSKVSILNNSGFKMP